MGSGHIFLKDRAGRKLCEGPGHLTGQSAIAFIQDKPFSESHFSPLSF